MQMVNKTVRVVAVAVAMMLVAGTIMIVLYMLVVPRAEAAEPEFHWNQAVSKPYATTREEAIRTRENAFRSISLPTPVITQFLRVTEKPGQDVKILTGDHFESFIADGSVFHDVVVSPFYTSISAEKWEVRWERKVFSAFLISSKNNHFYWSFKIRTDTTIIAVAYQPFGAERIPITTIARAI